MLLAQPVWDHLHQLVTYPLHHVVMYFIPIVLKNGCKVGKIIALNAEKNLEKMKSSNSIFLQVKQKVPLFWI